jgi:long-chain acyl-CoA synthetase
VLVRGASISGATWSGGALHPRTDEWLATGDLAETEPSGELRFLGRKSEVIVTAAGVNLHPEDLEAAIEEEPGVAACAVVPWRQPPVPNPAPCSPFAARANRRRRPLSAPTADWRSFSAFAAGCLWPEPDLPRTSTGKVGARPCRVAGGQGKQERT